jgi:hypothetical protein
MSRAESPHPRCGGASRRITLEAARRLADNPNSHRRLIIDPESDIGPVTSVRRVFAMMALERDPSWRGPRLC